jgi:TonB family protein
MGQTADLTTAGFARWAPANARERNFWIALAFALLFHAAFFVGAIRSKPSHLGDPTGDDKAISVSLVTEADLKSRSTIAEPPDSPPAPPPAAATPPPPPETPKPPQPEAKQLPVPDTPKPPEPTPAAEPSPEQPAEEQTAKQEDTKVDANAPDLLSLDDQNPAKMKSESKPKPDTAPKKATTSKAAPKKQPSQKRMSSLDLSTPPSMMQQPSMNSGRSAGFQRPPGITRSGVNDAFARAVIRALQQTMPQLNGALGRVTVRILLSESGNVVEVKLLAGAKDPSLSQDVVFAAQQTSYPIPPAGSNVADRTFMVTYVYD